MAQTSFSASTKGIFLCTHSIRLILIRCRVADTEPKGLPTFLAVFSEPELGNPFHMVRQQIVTQLQSLLVQGYSLGVELLCSQCFDNLVAKLKATSLGFGDVSHDLVARDLESPTLKMTLRIVLACLPA